MRRILAGLLGLLVLLGGLELAEREPLFGQDDPGRTTLPETDGQTSSQEAGQEAGHEARQGTGEQARPEETATRKSAQEPAGTSQESGPATTLNPEEVEERMRALLKLPTTLSVEQVPLQDFAHAIHDLHKINVYVDRRALEEYGMDDQVPVTGMFSGMQLKSALNLALQPLDLSWYTVDETLVITTSESASYQLQTRLISAHDLLTASTPDDPRIDHQDARRNDLLDTIKAMIEPNSWDELGGPGSMESFRGVLVVSQTREALASVESLVATMRRVKADCQASPDSLKQSVYYPDGDMSISVRELVDVPITLDFDSVPLEHVMKQVSSQAKVPIVVDGRALEDVGLSPDIPISLHLASVPMSGALKLALRGLGLTFTIHDEALVITTGEVAQAQAQWRIYPVHDLVSTSYQRPLPWRTQGLRKLVEVLTTTIGPDTWDAVGGYASIQYYCEPAMLIVSHTEEYHDQIAETLRKLRKASEPKEVDDPLDQVQFFQYVLAIDESGKPMIPAETVVDLLGRIEVEGELIATGNRLMVRATERQHARLQARLREIGMWSFDHFPARGGAGMGGGMGGGLGGGFGGGTGGLGGGFFE